MSEKSDERNRIVESQLIGIWNHNNDTRAIPVTTPMPDYRQIHRRLPERPKRGTTELPNGGKMIYNGDLTVLDKEGEFVSWMDAGLVGMLFDEEVDCGAVVDRPTWVWVETGVALERYLRKHGGYAVPNAFAARVLEKPPESIEWRDDGCRDLTPGLARDLEKTIGILERCRAENLLSSARLLREVMPEIRLLGNWGSRSDARSDA